MTLPRALVWVWLVVASVAVGSSSPASALVSTYRTGIDLGPNPATGCDFDLGLVPPGSLPGFELEVTVLVDVDAMPPQVVSAQVETCNGGTFGNAQALAGFMLAFDGGFLAADSIIGPLPLSLLGGANVIRLAFHALAGLGEEDALFSVDGTVDGAPIIAVVDDSIPAPMFSASGTAVLVLLLLALGLHRGWRSGWATTAALVALAVVSGAIVYADFGEPIAVDDQADASPANPRIEIFAAFVMPSEDEVVVRLDVEDFPSELACSDLIDNDSDGQIDCADPECDTEVCDDLNGCTTGERCTESTCIGTAVDCRDGNECTLDFCISLGPDSFICGNPFDVDKTDFGSCVPESNCAVDRVGDGACPEVLDECVLGRCVANGVAECEGQEKTLIATEEGGCDDGSPDTVDGCMEGVCSNEPEN